MHPRLAIAAGSLVLMTGCTAGPMTVPPVAPATSAVSATTPSQTPTSGESGGPSCPAVGSTTAPIDESTVPAFPKNTGLQQGKTPMSAQQEAHDGIGDLVIRAITVHEHAAFDRLVVTLDGSSSLGWGVRYVPVARDTVTAEPITMRGDRFLEINTSLGEREISEDCYNSDPPVVKENSYPKTTKIAQVYVGSNQDDGDLIQLGLRGSKSVFRAFTLTNPIRLVVDIKH